jgi:hypothetical protein
MRALFRTTTALAAFSTLGLSALGCSTTNRAPSSAASPEATAGLPTKTAAEPQAAPGDSGQAEATPEAAKASEPSQPAEEPRDGLRKASRPPIELLTGNNVVYVFNFPSSAIGTSIKERCESRSDDRAAVRECIEKERGKIPVESVRFVKDASGQYWWVTYNRYKGNLLKWNKVQFLPGKQDADSVSLNLIGKDKGIAPMARIPHSLKIELPNDYSIVISHPEHGDMLYDAKIGLMDPD